MTRSARGLRDSHPDVVVWRRARLLSAGFDMPLAARVAASPRYDLHALIGLVERGCPPGLAVRILAPIDEEAAGAER